MKKAVIKQRNNFFDLFKIIAIFGVIFVHFEQFYNMNSLISNEQLVFYNLLGYFAVPIFFAISGFFYSKTTNPIKSIQLLVTSFLLASIFFIPISTGFTEWTVNNSLTELLLELPKGSEAYWFLWTLAIIQIVYLVPKKWHYNNIIAIALCAFSTITFFTVYTVGVEYFNPNVDRLLQGVAPFSIGFLMGRYSKHFKESNKIFAISMTTTILIYVFTILNLKYYNSLSLILVISVILTCTSKKINLPAYFTQMGKNTLLIYILQYFAWIVLARIGIWEAHEINVLTISFFSLIVLFTCDFFARIFNKIIIYFTTY